MFGISKEKREAYKDFKRRQRRVLIACVAVTVAINFGLLARFVARVLLQP